MINDKLKIKAEENYKTAQWAEEKEYYDAAVSRYYYCAYQKIIFISKEKNFYEDFSKEIGSHKKVIENFSKNLNQKLEPEDIIELNKMQQLRNLRNDADYKEQKIVNKNDFLLGFKFNYNAINDILDKLL